MMGEFGNKPAEPYTFPELQEMRIRNRKNISGE
jgi:hypothetical protein